MALAFKSRALRCSFCGRNDREVAKLIAGPKVFICDACVGVCNRILEGTPQSFAGWDKMTDEALLASLKPALATVEATRAGGADAGRGAAPARHQLGGDRGGARHVAPGGMGAVFLKS